MDVLLLGETLSDNRACSDRWRCAGIREGICSTPDVSGEESADREEEDDDDDDDDDDDCDDVVIRCGLVRVVVVIRLFSDSHL